MGGTYMGIVRSEAPVQVGDLKQRIYKVAVGGAKTAYMILSSLLAEFYNGYNAHARAQHSDVTSHTLARRGHAHTTFFVVSACLIPVLVILSGIFAGLTLGYMSLDETQLNVLASSGTAKQREYANKIIPVRKNGHLLLVSLLLANMIVNETLPVISDQVLGGGVSAVAVSTVLIVIFSEIIPQSICTRYGLYIGAKCAIPVRILMYSLYIIAWPVAKLLETVLGPHHGIIYRRGELKELINMHSSISPHGGDLKHDTVAIIGHTLDLQEKVVKDAMTPITNVFMLPLESRLDYQTLRKVCESGHSRVPVYEEIEVPVYKDSESRGDATKVKKIVGILLVKQCVLLDPKEATPVRSIPLNMVPSVPFDEPLLGILDRFQEGRSHMAIVSLYSKGRAASVKEAVKMGLTRRFLNSVGLGEDGDVPEAAKNKDLEEAREELREGEIGDAGEEAVERHKDNTRRFRASIEGREQTMPADAVLASEDADDFLRGLDTDVDPLGIITLEDVLEELIGEEILDEFDLKGPQAASFYVPPAARRAAEEQYMHRTPPGPHPTSLPEPMPAATTTTSAVRGAGALLTTLPALPTLQFPRVTSGLGIFSRARSQPGTPTGTPKGSGAGTPKDSGPGMPLPEYVYMREKEALDLGSSEEDGGGDGKTTGTTTTAETHTVPTMMLPTLTWDTGTTAAVPAWNSEDDVYVRAVQAQRGVGGGDEEDDNVMRIPDILVSDEHGRISPAASTPGSGGSPLPTLTEAILQTQTRRRVQLQQQQQQAHHAQSTSGLMSAGGGGGGHEKQQQHQIAVPTVGQRQGPKGRFKSSPLVPNTTAMTTPPRVVGDLEEEEEEKNAGADIKDKVPDSDPDLEGPREGL